MNAGLVWLIRRAPGAWVRGVRRKIGGVKGILVAVVVAFFLVLIVAAQIAQWITDGAAGRRVDPEAVRTFGPPILLAFLLLLDLSGKGIYFRPAEIDFLFPAPLSRRDLLLYQMASRGGIQALSGLWTSVFTMRFAGTAGGAVLASVLVMLFLQMTAQVAALVAAAAGERLGPRIRLVAWASVGVVVVIAVRSAVADVPGGTPLPQSLRAIATSPWIVGLTLPVRPFVEAFAATSYADAAFWSGVCVAFLAGLVLLTLRLDVAYEEAALASSRKMQERLRRMRSGEGAFLPSGGSAARRTFPRLPRWGGAGPLARRQFIELLRNPAGALWAGGSVLVLVVFFLALPRFQADAGRHADAGWIAAAAASVFLPLVIVQGFGFDFRRDLDRMDVLKSLPLRPLAVAAGQLLVPAAIFTALQFVACALVVAASPVPAWALPASLLVLVPWNWFTSGVDNALFLLLPYRIDPEDPAKVPFLGRLMLTAMAKMACFGVVAFFVAVPCAIGLGIGGAGGAVLVGISWLVLVTAAAGATVAVAAAFRAFDVARDAAP